MWFFYLTHCMLYTKRLLLRPFQLSDLNDYHSIFAQKAIGDWLGRSDGFTLEQTKAMLLRMIQTWENYGYGPWAMIHLEHQNLIGHCGLKYTQRFEVPELLYAIDPAYQRQGLTVEAAQQALVWGHETCGLSDFVCYTQPHNLASRGVMEKLGFQFQHDFMHADLPHLLYRLSI